MAVDPLRSAARAHKALEHLSLMQLVKSADELTGAWVAIFLGDGTCDQRLYRSKAEAVRFQFHETQCAYMAWSGLPKLSELRFFLDTNEELYDAGMSLADPGTYINPEALL